MSEKEQYEKPEIYTEDVSTAFSGACCTSKSPIGALPGSFSPFVCLPGCHWEYNTYQA